MQYGQQIQVAWRKQPVFIVRHTKESLKNIDSVLPKLADPNSDQIDEPYKGQNPTRSKSDEYTVMVGVCTHLGCSPNIFQK
jgi:ubiquinol-cytochrome c reductase iron-sulfur subunit